MNEETQQLLLSQISTAIEGIEQIKESNKIINQDIKEIKAEIVELKINLGKVETKIEGIETRLGNEETISRIALGSVAGGTMLAFIKYIFFSG